MSFRTRIDPNWHQNLPRAPQDFGPKDPTGQTPDDRLLIVDRTLEPQTIPHFLEFAMSGELPTGGKMSLPTLSIDDFQQYMMTPYSQWAPGPHDKFSASPLDHVMIRIGSTQDPERLVIVEKGIHAMKSRLWEGIMPLSDNRWQQKQLDEPEYHHLACRYIGLVIEVFAYFQYPPILEGLTSTYNLILDHFRDFDRVVNALPGRQGQPPIQLAALWETYITALYTSIATRAHSWVISKAERLKTRDYGLLSSQPSDPSRDDPSDYQVEILNRIQDSMELAAQADYTMFIHLPTSDPPRTSILPLLGQRRQQYAQSLRVRSRQYLMAEISDFSLDPENSPKRLLNVCRYQREAQNDLRLDLRKKPAKLSPAGWISSLRQKMARVDDKRWGFAIYRLTYTQTEEEWTDFLKRLEDGLADWGEGLDGASEIKEFASLQWFNGKELGIAEGDFNAAKKHFATLTSANIGDDSADPFFFSEVFLAIDSSSYDSFAYTSPFTPLLCAGDTGGFVTAIDVTFDVNDLGDHADESPHYPGWLRILPNLVYGDFFAMMSAQTQFPEDLWPLAMEHPEFVYVGPTVELQVKLWRQAKEVRWRLLQMIVEHIGNRK
ncbi:hypothetical protein K504DRAFT_468808 [Pleomassaria siparia CBS 279.74]|uniref:Uncharacterized protein n=1 Tax=Pleomassaria siparia CBS 279.74 TaxID=1314801 RepID=A0A6G1K6G2_9PLEO|nr:hypothetical protein K504DRAFT_468808 [Pleomassaria siparia CBS 279.74]